MFRSKLKRYVFMIVIGLNAKVVCADGSVSGGGGGTIPEDLAGQEAILDLLQVARGELLSFFNGHFDRADYPWNGGEYDGVPYFDNRVYLGKPNIYDVIRSTKIGIKMHGPCISSNGQEVDGSVNGPSENSICISVKNLSDKLTKDNFHRQTLALLVHEYSHLLGFNEDEAVKIQKNILFFYQYFNYPAGPRWSDYYHLQLSRGREEMMKVLNSCDAIKSSAQSQNPWISACASSRNLEDRFRASLSVVTFRPIPSYWGFRNFPLTRERLYGMRAASCGRASNAHDGDHNVYMRYLQIFGEQKFMDTAIFNNPSGVPGYPTVPSGVNMRRIDNKGDLFAEANDVANEISQFIAAIDELKIATTLIEF